MTSIPRPGPQQPPLHGVGVQPSDHPDFPNLGFDPAPGSKDAVRKLHDKLGKCADVLDETWDMVTKLMDGSYWKGEAAVAFRDQLREGPLPLNLRNAARSIRKAATQLDRWEDDLDDFQLRARRLEEKAHDARITLQQAQGRADKAGEDPDLEKKGGRGDDAQRTLDRVNDDLLVANQDLYRVLEKARQLAEDHEEQARRRAESIRDATDKLAPQELGFFDDLGWTAEGSASATGPDAGFSITGPGYGKEGMLKAYADLGHATAEGLLTNGWLKLPGIVDAYAGARATASVGITNNGVSGNAEASAGGRALAEGRVEAGHFGLYQRATGFAGAEAGISAGVGLEGVNAGGKAFAGAKGGVVRGTEIGGISAGGTAEGWVGAGAQADVTFGKDDDGNFRFGAKTGAALGIGGSLGMEITVDPGEVADTAHDAAGKLEDGAGKVGDAAGSAKDGFTSLF